MPESAPESALEPEPVTITRYTVHSANTGATVCGPYDSEREAKRELKRLNREAALGRTARSDAHPQGQALTPSTGGELCHKGVPQSYEIRSSEGVIVPDAD